jgi:hypothetical protein
VKVDLKNKLFRQNPTICIYNALIHTPVADSHLGFSFIINKFDTLSFKDEIYINTRNMQNKFPKHIPPHQEQNLNGDLLITVRKNLVPQLQKWKAHQLSHHIPA